MSLECEIIKDELIKICDEMVEEIENEFHAAVSFVTRIDKFKLLRGLLDKCKSARYSIRKEQIKDKIRQREDFAPTIY